MIWQTTSIICGVELEAYVAHSKPALCQIKTQNLTFTLLPIFTTQFTKLPYTILYPFGTRLLFLVSK